MGSANQTSLYAKFRRGVGLSDHEVGELLVVFDTLLMGLEKLGAQEFNLFETQIRLDRESLRWSKSWRE